MASDHILKRYDEELERLNATINEMGGLTESQFAKALTAVRDRDTATAEEVIADDARVDALEPRSQEQTVQAAGAAPADGGRPPRRAVLDQDRHRPRAHRRLRQEHRQALDRADPGASPPSAVAGIDRLGRLVRTALKDVLDAFADDDVDKAHSVWERDEEIDEVYTGLFRELLTYMMEDPRTITACTHLLFMAKNIERIGDHATNIAELVSFRTHRPELRRGAAARARGALYTKDAAQ